MERIKKYKLQEPRNTDGKVNEIQMARLKKFRWQGSRGSRIQMARFKKCK
jgi:hypothetical protein